jgi:uncharacterized protein
MALTIPNRNPPDFLGVGWAFPVAVQGGRVAMRADEQLIAQSILLILMTSRGERVMEPQFGCDLKELVFTADTAAMHIAEHSVSTALGAWEPRIRVSDVTAAPDPQAPDLLLINIEYVIRSYNSRHNLVYPFHLG